MAILRSLGFEEVRHRGSHKQFCHPIRRWWAITRPFWKALADAAARRVAVSKRCYWRSLISVPFRRRFASSTALLAMATTNRVPFSGSAS